jgi:hypothetical protein
LRIAPEGPHIRTTRQLKIAEHLQPRSGSERLPRQPAYELGAEVVHPGKAPAGQEGGNTRVAGQAYLNTSPVEHAVAYVTALRGPYTVPEAIVRVWSEEMYRTNAGARA